MSDSCVPGRRRLAEGPFCSIDACTCGTLHVSVGALTLRLERQVAEAIWNTLGQALHELHDTEAVTDHLQMFRRRGSSRPS